MRIGKISPSPFEEGEMLCAWFAISPFFEMMRKMKKVMK
jgi:hypothetical protein